MLCFLSILWSDMDTDLLLRMFLLGLWAQGSTDLKRISFSLAEPVSAQILDRNLSMWTGTFFLSTSNYPFYFQQLIRGDFSLSEICTSETYVMMHISILLLSLWLVGSFGCKSQHWHKILNLSPVWRRKNKWHLSCRMPCCKYKHLLRLVRRLTMDHKFIKKIKPSKYCV